MKTVSSWLSIFTTSLGLLTVNLAIPLPAKASVICEPGTITNHANGSPALCILSQDMNLQISSLGTDTSNFICKGENYIAFNEKAQFTSCILAEEMKIIKSNTVETCLPEYRVEVSTSEDGSLVISCKSLRLSLDLLQH